MWGHSNESLVFMPKKKRRDKKSKTLKTVKKKDTLKVEEKPEVQENTELKEPDADEFERVEEIVDDDI